MSLNKALQDLKFDNRLFELNMKQGRLTKEEIEKHQKSLEDLEANSEKINIEKEEVSSLN
jgi:hypothetical protein